MTATQELAYNLDPWVQVQVTELGALGYRSLKPTGGWIRLAALVDHSGWERVADVADVRVLLERVERVTA